MDNQSAEIESLIPINPDNPKKLESFLQDFGMEWSFTEHDGDDGGVTDYDQQKKLIREGMKRLNALSESRAIAELEKLKVAFDTDRKTFDFSPATYDFIIDKRLAELKERNE